MIRSKRMITLALFFLLMSSMGYAEAPEHYTNPPENINTTPNYIPGPWPMPDIFAAKTAYELNKQEWKEDLVEEEGLLYTLGIGEIAYSSIKNETATVLGYFRNYTGFAKVEDGKLKRMQMMIDVNSMDTGVPGRNHRILEIFFESMNPEFGKASITFDKFKKMKKLEKWKDGKVHEFKAFGSLTFHGTMRPIRADLKVQYLAGSWKVTTKKPIDIFISDYKLGEQALKLMKVCNHKSLGNKVEVKTELYFR